jgi:tetrahydromethanopterin S-methyltransferase subunit E
VFPFFCPKFTINLTYLCYGESNVYEYSRAVLSFRQKTIIFDQTHKIERKKDNFILRVQNGFKIKKGKREFTFFCPKSTMNLTYLCYGIVKYISIILIRYLQNNVLD